MLPLQLINTQPADSAQIVPYPRVELEMLKSLSFDEVMDKLVNAAVDFAIHLVAAVA